jgi:hypothetical protein
MYPAFVGVAIFWPEWNALRLVLFNNAAFVGFFRLQVSGAPGSIVVPSHGSPANLAGIKELRSASRRRWSADVGIAGAISKPGASARRHRVPCMFDSLRVQVPYPT